jgi:hypothetical protein
MPAFLEWRDMRALDGWGQSRRAYDKPITNAAVAHHGHH